MIELVFPCGVRVRLSAGFFAVTAFIWQLTGTGTEAAGAMAAAVLLHESGHLFAFLHTGIPIRSVTLDLRGITIRPDGGIYPAGNTAWTIAAGAVMSGLAAAALARSPLSPVWWQTSLAAGGYALLPFPGTDGGELLSMALTRLFPGKRCGWMVWAAGIICTGILTALFFLRHCTAGGFVV